jgi:lysophospholipase L1-like esterase
MTEFAEIFEGGAEKSRMLAPLYAEVAKSHGCPFFDAGKIMTCSDADGLHFDAPGHKVLGEALAKEVKKILRT